MFEEAKLRMQQEIDFNSSQSTNSSFNASVYELDFTKMEAEINTSASK